MLNHHPSMLYMPALPVKPSYYAHNQCLKMERQVIPMKDIMLRSCNSDTHCVCLLCCYILFHMFMLAQPHWIHDSGKWVGNIYVHVSMYNYVYVGMYVCKYVCMYIESIETRS